MAGLSSSTPLSVHQLRKTYGEVVAVDGLDLEVRAGECFGLLGPNGAGKTTTIEIIEGLLEATSGEVEVLGMHWGTHDSDIRQRIGISLQETKLSEKLSVRETLTLFRSFYRQGLEPAEAVALVSLEEKADAWVGKLSGGQQQRLAVACALVGNPELLFLDEPTTGLDPQARRQLWDIIRSLREQGRTVLLTTHYMDEAERLCDRIAIVDHGQVIALGSPRDLIASLGGEHVIDFTLINGQADGATPSFDIDDVLRGMPAVTSVRREMEHYALSVTEPHLALPAILERLRQHHLELASLTTRHASLEDVFVTLTGRHLRDDATP
jgi:ABC-2 type transport system ATP-binding protein